MKIETVEKVCVATFAIALVWSMSMLTVVILSQIGWLP